MKAISRRLASIRLASKGFFSTAHSTMAQNKVAVMLEAGKPLSINEAAIPEPGAQDIIVRNRAVALNPIDVFQRNTGFMVNAYPYTLGHDVAGEVHAVGSDVTRFKPGTRVLAHAWGMIRGGAENGGFALYSRVPAGNAVALPESIKDADAAVLPLAMDTAIAGLYAPGPIGLPHPAVDAQATGGVLVVYGGSSSVGVTAIQLAAASGARVVAIASTRNHGLCKTAGASHVFDYKNESLVADVVSAVGKDKFAGIYDAISTESTFKHDREILEKLGGGPLACTHPAPEDLPSNVTSKYVFGLGEFSFPLWEGALKDLLAAGKVKPLPEPLIVGRGLESIEAGLEKLGAGVSAQKVVVEL